MENKNPFIYLLTRSITQDSADALAKKDSLGLVDVDIEYTKIVVAYNVHHIQSFCASYSDPTNECVIYQTEDRNEVFINFSDLCDKISKFYLED